MSRDSIVQFVYTNHKGETELRTVDPIQIKFCFTVFHPGEAQWMLEGYDLNKQALRTFAVKDISGWKKFEELPKELKGDAR